MKPYLTVCLNPRFALLRSHYPRIAWWKGRNKSDPLDVGYCLAFTVFRVVLTFTFRPHPYVP